MRPLTSILVVAALALAGCLGGSDAGDGPAADPGHDEAPDGDDVEPSATDAPTSDDDNGTEPAAASPPLATTVTVGNLTSIALGAEADPFGTACCIGLVRDGDNYEGAFTPGANLTGIVVEVAWEDAQSDLDLSVHAPDYESVFPPEVNGTGITGSRGHAWWNFGGQAMAGDSPAKIVVTDPDALAIAGEWAWEVGGKWAQDTAFTVHLTLFYGNTPDESFSAIS